MNKSNKCFNLLSLTPADYLQCCLARSTFNNIRMVLPMRQGARERERGKVEKERERESERVINKRPILRLIIKGFCFTKMLKNSSEICCCFFLSRKQLLFSSRNIFPATSLELYLHSVSCLISGRALQLISTRIVNHLWELMIQHFMARYV